MNYLTMFKKGGLGFLTFLAAMLIANPGLITNLIPSNISQMTVGGAVAALIVVAANWLKNRNKQ